MESDRMMESYKLLTRENPVFSCFVVWTCALVIKHMLMSSLTVLQRFKTKTFPNPEDSVLSRGGEAAFGNEDVERVRRAHRNDMENILPYLTVGLLYVLTNPNVMLATNLYRVATVARFIHTFVYAVYVIPQPSRAIAFLVQWAITIFMAIMCIIYFSN